MPNLKKKILLLEINEIPWRLIDKVIEQYDFPNIKKFFLRSKTFTTIVDNLDVSLTEEKLVYGLSRDKVPVVIDSGELSPWVTWPTFHRGISSKEHKIRFLGQDVSTFAGKPIWKEFLDCGYNIGLCGSLQSWPPLNPGKGGFYIPDTFAHTPACIPSYVEPFQRFNLEQVQENGLVVRERNLLSGDLIKFLLSLPMLGITFKSCLQVVVQLFCELFDKNFLVRRPIFQSIILWDIFKSLYKINDPPAFSSFFTNHYASLMHRFWHNIFPSDFGDLYNNEKLAHSKTVLFGLKLVDEILHTAIKYCDQNKDVVVAFASSMGQDAIVYTQFEGISAELENANKLFTRFGLNKDDYKPLLAMVPQYALEIDNPEITQKIKNGLKKCKTVSGQPVFSFEEAGNTLSITIHTPSLADVKAGYLIYKDANNDIKLSWDEAGIIMHELEAATGYHIPEGILAFYGHDITPDYSRKKIKLTDARSMILQIAFSE